METSLLCLILCTGPPTKLSWHQFPSSSTGNEFNYFIYFLNFFIFKMKKKAKFLIFFWFKQSKVQGIPRWPTIQVPSLPYWAWLWHRPLQLWCEILIFSRGEQPLCSVTTVTARKIDQIDLRLLRKKWFSWNKKWLLWAYVWVLFCSIISSFKLLVLNLNFINFSIFFFVNHKGWKHCCQECSVWGGSFGSSRTCHQVEGTDMLSKDRGNFIIRIIVIVFWFVVQFVR